MYVFSKLSSQLKLQYVAVRYYNIFFELEPAVRILWCEIFINTFRYFNGIAINVISV